MAEVASPVEAQAKLTKTKKKKRLSQRKNNQSNLQKQILSAVSETIDRKGMSAQAIKKFLKNNGVDMLKCKTRFNRTLNTMVKNGTLIQMSGHGACGRFKLAKRETAIKPKKKVDKKMVKTKKPSAKASTNRRSIKKKIPKKSPAKKGKKSPAKAKKPTSKKGTLNKATPRKKRVTKKTPAKKASKKTGTKQTKK